MSIRICILGLSLFGDKVEKNRCIYLSKIAKFVVNSHFLKVFVVKCVAIKQNIFDLQSLMNSLFLYISQISVTFMKSVSRGKLGFSE